MRLLFVLASLLIIPACKKNKVSPNGGNSGNEFFKIGTRWTYNYQWFDLNGNLMTEDNVSEVIVRDTTINSAKYFITLNNRYFTFKSTGFYEYDRFTHDELLFYKLQVSKGDVYQSRFPLSAPNTCAVEFNADVLNADTTVSVQNINYPKTIYYRFGGFSSCQFRQNFHLIYFGTQRGLLLRDDFYVDGLLTLVIKLTSFTY